MKKSVLVVVVALVGCASYQPVIDTKNVDMNRYTADLGECQRFAEQRDPAASAAVGAVAGAVLGFALATVAGVRYDAGATARVGAVAGAASGAGQGAESQMNIIRNCLRGRGYSVLQ